MHFDSFTVAFCDLIQHTLGHAARFQMAKARAVHPRSRPRAKSLRNNFQSPKI